MSKSADTPVTSLSHECTDTFRGELWRELSHSRYKVRMRYLVLVAGFLLVMKVLVTRRSLAADPVSPTVSLAISVQNDHTALSLPTQCFGLYSIRRASCERVRVIQRLRCCPTGIGHTTR